MLWDHTRHTNAEFKVSATKMLTPALQPLPHISCMTLSLVSCIIRMNSWFTKKYLPSSCFVWISQELRHQFSLQGVGRVFVCTPPWAGQETVVCVMVWPHFAFFCIMSFQASGKHVTVLSDTQEHSNMWHEYPSLCFSSVLEISCPCVRT